MKHIILHIAFTIALIISSVGMYAQSIFTPIEQQSISVETPGLFDHSNVFTVDFSQLKPGDYVFPLPVGKGEIQSNHNIRITSTKGDAVKAMFAGTVRLSRQSAAFGNVIVVRHNNGLESVYGNNAQNLVKVGDKVKAGQTLAIIGQKDGLIYCDFAMMVNGARINPATLFDVSKRALKKQTVRFEKRDKGMKVSVVGQQGTPPSIADRTVKSSDPTDLLDSTPDIDEYQVMKIEDAKNPFAKSNEFSINFAAYKDNEWSYPLHGAHVISPYGGKRRHGGTDIKTKPNDDIHAAFDGRVVLAGTHYGYGLCIIIRHANGLETLYSHNSKNLVKVGQWVKAGDVIGKVGRTGRATTEHIHFEVRCAGKAFDSAKLYDHNANKLRKEVFVFRRLANGTITISSKKN